MAGQQGPKDCQLDHRPEVKVAVDCHWPDWTGTWGMARRTRTIRRTWDMADSWVAWAMTGSSCRSLAGTWSVFGPGTKSTGRSCTRDTWARTGNRSCSRHRLVP